jgi:hypothetical protein
MTDTRTHAGSVGGLAVGGVVGAIIADGPGALVGMWVGGWGMHYALSKDSRHAISVTNQVEGAAAAANQVVHAWLGTMTGGALGLLVAGPVGAVIGGVIGYIGRDAPLLDQAPPA